MRDERLYLQDIVEAVESIEIFLSNIKEKDFASNELIQSAVLYKLSIIGEASSRISAELKSRYPEIEWKEIIGFRNFAVHAYFAVNQPIVWTTATEDAAVLKQQVELILKKEFPDFESRGE